MAIIVLLMLFGLALIVAPFVLPFYGVAVLWLTQAIMMGSGVVLVVLSATLITITRLYVKTKASEAFVRTGMGGLRVVKDGGALVIPVVHQVVRVSLQTIRLEVGREGSEALITQDKLRADIRAEFFVRVQPDDDSIKNAARSFGEKMGDPNHVKALVEDKLISALRTVAATRTLEELNTERDKFMAQVTQIVTADLAHNGLTLETAAISKLDQTGVQHLRDDNVFDAQGKRTVAEITQRQLTERNQLERDGERRRKEQDVATKTKVLELERVQAEAEATQQAQIAQARAEQERAARQKQIEAEQAVQTADVQKVQAVEVAKCAQQQAIEVAERVKQQAVAKAEAEQVNAQSELAKAEAMREEARQAIKTVEVTATAERDKQQQIIKAQAAAETNFVTAQRTADAAAYGVQKQAEARKAAAGAEAEAITKKATAEAEAAKAKAEGDKALALVPVQVESERVAVAKRQVDEVLKPELEARKEYGDTAQQFELAKLRITREAEVRIAGAQASAKLFGSINAQVFGTPADVSRMVGHYMDGMGVARAVDGFLAGADNGNGAARQMLSLLGAVARKLGLPTEPVADEAEGSERPAESPVKGQDGPDAPASP